MKAHHTDSSQAAALCASYNSHFPVLRHQVASTTSFFLSFFFFFNFWDRERQSMNRGRGRERGRHRIGNKLQAPSHQPRARRGARTHGPRDRDLAEVGRLTDCATQVPPTTSF